MHVIAAARAVGAGGCVIGVEPQPAALLRARANIDLNGVAGIVRLVSAAVGHGADLTPMSWSSVENSGAASLLDSGPGFVVPLLQLSTVIEKLCPGALHLMLLDVQGYEVPALKGLAMDRLPDLLIVEDGAEWLDKAGSSRQQLYGQMERNGAWASRDLLGNVVTPDGPPLLEENLVGVRQGTSVNWLPARAVTPRDRIPVGGSVCPVSGASTPGNAP